MNFLRPLSVAALLLLLGVTALPADTLLKKLRTADEVPAPGRIAESYKNRKVEIWIGADRVLRDDGRTALLLRLDQRKLYIADRAQKMYVALDLEQKDGRWRAITGLPATPGGAEAWVIHAKAEPTQETRQVGAWKALRYQVALSNEIQRANRIRFSWWVAPDLTIEDAPLRTLTRILASLSFSGDEWIETLQSLPGQPVLFERVEQLPDTEAKAREELVAVEHREAPAGTYEVPAGFHPLAVQEYLHAYGVPEPF